MAKRKRKTEHLRDACIREALEIIGETGLEKLSLREVARRLKVSHQAPYKHFPSRDHILAAVVSHLYASFAEYLDGRPRSDDPMEDLSSLGQAYLTYGQTHPLYYKLMFETQLPDPAEHTEMMERARHAFAILNDAVGRLPGRPDGTPSELDAMFIWTVMHGLTSIQRSHALETLSLSPGVRQSIVPFAMAQVSVALRAARDGASSPAATRAL